MLLPLMFVFTCLQCALCGYFVGQGESYWLLASLSTSLLGAYVLWCDGRNADSMIRAWREMATDTNEANQ